MFLPEKLPVAVHAPVEKHRREIHVFVDRNAPRGPTLTFEPRGVVEKAVANEVIDVLGVPLRARNAGLRGASDCVAVAAAICERHGWVLTEQWLDEAKDLHVRLAKDVG